MFQGPLNQGLLHFHAAPITLFYMQITFIDKTGFAPTCIHYGQAQTELGALFSGFADGCVYYIGLVPDGQGLDEAMARRRDYFAASIDFVRDDAGAAAYVAQIMAAWRDGQAADLRLVLRGTDFQRDVWQALLAIPKGEVATYGAIAAQIGRPKAVRAVGSATGFNPMSLLVPCHRVVPASGGLGNFGWGCAVKRRLLAAEGVEF